MKYVIPGFALLCLAVAGCTSLQPTRMPTDELHEEIRAGTIVSAGDEIRVTTADGSRHLVVVQGLTDDTMRGLTREGAIVEVAIDDIAVVETWKLSFLRTAGFVYVGAPVLYGAFLFVFLVLPTVL